MKKSLRHSGLAIFIHTGYRKKLFSDIDQVSVNVSPQTFINTGKTYYYYWFHLDKPKQKILNIFSNRQARKIPTTDLDSR